MMEFGLIRHGKTLWNLEKRIQGREDIPLYPGSIRQISLWAERLRYGRYDLILSSPLKRAQQTSMIISEKLLLDIEYDEDLQEQDFGDWEGKTLQAIKTLACKELETQVSRGWEFCPPHGESRITVFKRASDAIKKAGIKYDKKHILIITHNSVIKSLIYKLRGRAFLPDEPPLLHDYNLHKLIFDGDIKIKKLNSINLMEEALAKPLRYKPNIYN